MQRMRMHRNVLRILTIYEYLGRFFIFLSLFHGPVPDGAFVLGSVILLARTQGQNGGCRQVLVLTDDEFGFNGASISAQPEPLYLGWRRSANGRTCEVERTSFGSSWRVWSDGGRRRLQKDCQVDGLGVELSSGPTFFHTALELPVVPVVGGGCDRQVVDSFIRSMIDSTRTQIKSDVYSA